LDDFEKDIGREPGFLLFETVRITHNCRYLQMGYLFTRLECIVKSRGGIFPVPEQQNGMLVHKKRRNKCFAFLIIISVAS